MGCNENNSRKYPVLLFSFENGNEEQKQYCLQIKDSFTYHKPVRFEIQSNKTSTFSVKLKIKENEYIIQENYDNSEVVMQETLDKMYKLLDSDK